VREGAGVEVADGAMTAQTKNLKDLAETLDKLQLAMNQKLRVPPGSVKTCVMLAMSFYENMRAFIDLIPQGYGYAGCSNARSALEAMIDFKALKNDPVHLKVMGQQFLHQKKHVITSASRAARHHSIQDADRFDWAEREVTDTSKKISSLEKISKKRREQLILEHVDPSGIVVSLYAMLCDLSHNSLSALGIRHLRILPDGSEDLVVQNELDQKIIEALCVLMAAFSDQLSEFFDELKYEMN